jgi:diacylglycerol kinase family enzyme
MRHFFVINPHSFRHKKTEKLKQLLLDINECFSDFSEKEYEIYRSRYPRDAVAAVHRYITEGPPDETVRIYAVGGDGILFDCLNGMVDFPNAELTGIPYGSANDFILSFGQNAENSFRSIKNLLNAKPLLVDIIDCGSNYAMKQVAFGIEAQAIINANKLFRHPRFKWLNKRADMVYKAGAVSAVMNEEIKRQKYQVILDGEDVSGCYCNISVSNSPCMGGTMISSPYARPDNGFLDVIFTKGGSTFAVINYIGDYTKGHFEKNNAFFRRQMRKMEIKSNVPIRVHLDGESFYTEEVKLEILPSRIKFFAPEGMEFADYSYRAYKPDKTVGRV